MNRTAIEYLDFTWNPITGCQGLGCAVRPHCWARTMANRLRGRYGYPKEDPFQPTFHPGRLNEPFKVKKPSRIGVCFMGDYYGKSVNEGWRARVHAVMSLCYRHTFIILTKQPQNIPFRYLDDHIWLGASINQKKDLWRIDELLRHQAAVHILSCEPLYEDLGKIDLTHIEWLIIGAQTRPNRQPKAAWVKSLMDQADAQGVRIFLKDNLAEWQWYKCREYPIVAEHYGLGDKYCPRCGKKEVIWKNIANRKIRGIYVEWGRYVCQACGWRSELHETDLIPE